MNRLSILSVTAGLSIIISAGVAAAAIDIAPGSLTQSIADSGVYDYATSTLDPVSLFQDDFAVPTTATTHAFDEQAVVLARGYELHSSVKSEVQIRRSESTLVFASGSGDSFADLTSGEAGTYGETQSVYITNLKFHISVPVRIDWQYEASGHAGMLGTSDGIDMRVAIREFSDDSYAGSAITNVVTNQFLGAGLSQQSFVLAPGYYDLRTQGRVLFNQPNESNRDGSSQWAYEYTITSLVPEPSSYWLAAVVCGGGGTRWVGRRAKRTR